MSGWKVLTNYGLITLDEYKADKKSVILRMDMKARAEQVKADIGAVKFVNEMCRRNKSLQLGYGED